MMHKFSLYNDVKQCIQIFSLKATDLFIIQSMLKACQKAKFVDESKVNY